jgi:hypothetical protein
LLLMHVRRWRRQDRRPGFNPRVVHVGFVEKVRLGHCFIRTFRFFSASYSSANAPGPSIIRLWYNRPIWDRSIQGLNRPLQWLQNIGLIYLNERSSVSKLIRYGLSNPVDL